MHAVRVLHPAGVVVVMPADPGHVHDLVGVMLGQQIGPARLSRVLPRQAGLVADVVNGHQKNSGSCSRSKRCARSARNSGGTISREGMPSAAASSSVKLSVMTAGRRP